MKARIWFGRLILKYLLFQYKNFCVHLGLLVPPNTCGPGLMIVHWGLTVINAQARIGENCRIYAGVNIGGGRGGAPRIGKNVYIWPGAKLFGGIIIGDDVRIGANAVVNKSFGDNVTIAGVPARELHTSVGSESSDVGAE